VVQLNVHLGHRFLHVLNVRGGVVNESLALPQVSSESNHVLLRPKAATQETELVKLL
jgi:hypothetical protein